MRTPSAAVLPAEIAHASRFIRVATPATEHGWLARVSQLSCRELEAVVAAESKTEEQRAEATHLVCRFVDARTVRVTVELTPEQFALLDQAIGTIGKELGTGDAADALELIARAYLARVGEERPALRQQIVVHRCRECRQEWRETSKGRVPARVSHHEPTEVVAVDDPEEERELDRTSHVGSRSGAKLSRYIPRSVVRNVHWRDEGRWQVPGCLNGRWSQLHHVRFFSRGGVFTPRRMAALEGFVREKARALLEPLAAAGGGDFVQDFSTPLPMDVIFTLLGVPDADRRQLREWIDIALDRDPGNPEFPPRALEAGLNGVRYWFELLPELRKHPNDGLISSLFDAEIETDDGGTTRLTDGEIVGFCSLLGAAGSETTTRLLAFAALLFARHPDQYATVLADPRRLPDAVEEVLRWSSPAQYAVRLTTRDVEWYGQRIPAGGRVLLLLGAANRDERQYPDPDRFDIGRGVPAQLGFGQGVHFCLGASLARLESRVALEEFSQRFPRYTVDEARAHRVHMSNVHGYDSLPFSVE